MTPRPLFLLCGALSVALAQTSWGQKASSWRVWKAADGLPESACVSVAVAPHGKVLARHLTVASVSELDGYSVNSIGLPEIGNARIQESPSGQLWALAPEGLLESQGGGWVLHPVAEIAAGFKAGKLRAIAPGPLCRLKPVRQGLVLVLLPDALLEVNCESPEHRRTRVLRQASQTQLGDFASLAPARDGGLWVSGARGLAKIPGPIRNLKPESEWREYLVPESCRIQNLQEPHEDLEGGLTVVAESSTNQQNVIARLSGEQWAVETVAPEKLRRAWCGPDNSCWATTIRSLFQWEKGDAQMQESEDISVRQYFDLAVEPGGAFWLATSEGLFRYAPPAWRSPGPIQQLHSPVHCLAGDEQGRVWFATGNGLHLLENHQEREFRFPGNSELRGLQMRLLLTLRGGALLLAADSGLEKEDSGDRLCKFVPLTGAYHALTPGEAGSSYRLLGVLKEGKVCVQTLSASSQNDGLLQVYNGSRFEPFPEPAPDRATLGTLHALFAAQNGDLWVGGEHATAWYHEKKWRTFASADRSTPEGVFCFAEMPDGKIWGANREQVWAFDGRAWSGVRRGFDRINGMQRAHDGSVWVASNSGLHRYFQGAWVENGIGEGLPGGTISQVCEDQRGRIWAATSRGLTLYHPDADPDPPRTSIQNMAGDNVPDGGTITLTFKGHDKWKFTPEERLLYSYRLDERDWTPFHEANGVAFTDLPPGKHYFQVRAMDRNCNLETKPAQHEFAVILPWYKEVRLVLVALAGLAGALFFAGLAYNRHRRLVRSYAEVEQQVAQRTRELELASRQLLHSQKMNALGALAAGIAHDFNNILSIIKGSAQIIEDNLDQPEKVRVRLDRIKTVVEQGAGIVKAMLGFSRDSGQQPGPCDLNAVVSDTIKLLGDRFLHEVQVAFEPWTDGALPPARGSKDFVQQVLLNFIFNAAESMNGEKRIVVATRRLDALPAGLVLEPAPGGAYVAASVQDFGCGITPENLPRIFEPFFTTKALSARRGTGLGLSMAYELARKMGAGLAVESVVGRGSTFTLILPASADTPNP